MEEDQQLTKRERRILAKTQKAQQRQSTQRKRLLGYWAAGVLGAILILGAGWWVWKESTKPLAGEQVEDLGREHVPDGTQVEFNSNPPTSGKHYGDWTRAGVYDKPISDGHLVHALEHGYVIISYNCRLLPSAYHLVPLVSAHEEELEQPPAPKEAGEQTDTEKESSESVELGGGEWQSEECKDLVSKLTSIYEKKGKRKLIVIPRPGLDKKIALTAWARIDKLDPSAPLGTGLSTSSGLGAQDEERIIRFIDAFRDQGPEKTAE